MARRIGWLALAAVAGLALVTSVVGMAWQLGTAVRDREVGGIVGSLVVGTMVVLFWKWIGLGAWERAHPAIDPETGRPLAPADEIGPWGWVGRALMGGLVLGLVGIGVWAGAENGDTAARTDRVREAADLAARRADLTVERVAATETAYQVWLLARDDDAPRGPNPLRELLTVPGASVADVSTTGDTAAVLVRPREGPPCVVIDVDRDDLVSTRVTTRC